MPGLDATGPQGQGPMTGWRQGRCQGDVNQPDPAYAGRGRGGHQVRGGFRGRYVGRGRRRGFDSRGRGFRRGGAYAGRSRAFTAPPNVTSTRDLAFLKREAEVYAQNLERIEARIAELEASPEASPEVSPTSTEST
jgi:hypothetical protein